jgi:hypothetical protein
MRDSESWLRGGRHATERGKKPVTFVPQTSASLMRLDRIQTSLTDLDLLDPGRRAESTPSASATHSVGGESPDRGA